MSKTAKANLRYLKIAPRKVRSVADLIRGRAVGHAQAQLMVQTRRSSEPLAKLLASAIANAELAGMDMEKLYISSIQVNQGPMRKMLLPKARGRGTVLQKISSHVSLELSEKEGLKAPLFIIPKRSKASAEMTERVEKTNKVDKAHDHTIEKTKVKGTEGAKAKLFNRKAGES